MEFKGAKAFLMIPVGISRDQDLLKKPKSILLMGEIVSMLNVTGEFFMSNSELAKRLNVSTRSIIDYLNLLEDKKLIKRTNVYADVEQKIISGRKITAGSDLVKATSLGWGNVLHQGSETDNTRVVKQTSPKYNKLIDQSNRTDNRSSSSKPSSSSNEVKDPFSDSNDDDDEKVISGLIKMFNNEAHVSIPDYQYKQIMNNLSAMGRGNAIDLMYTVIDKVSRGGVQNPLGYLMVSITSASVPKPQGGEINGTN